MSEDKTVEHPGKGPNQSAREFENERKSLFTVAEAARLLKSTQRAVRQLLAKNRLDVDRDVATGESGITASSLLAYQAETKSFSWSAKDDMARPTLSGVQGAFDIMVLHYDRGTPGSFNCPPLAQVLGEIEDFRVKRGRRYKLSTLLMFVCAAMLCGYSTFADIVEWGHRHRVLLSQALGIHAPPSNRTLRLMYRGIDTADLNARLQAWCSTVMDKLAEYGEMCLAPEPTLPTALTSSRFGRHQIAGGSEQLVALGRCLGLVQTKETPLEFESRELMVQGVFKALFFEGKVAYLTTSETTLGPVQ